MLKKALVTGSAKGIGKAIALDLAKRGFDVAIHYNRSAEAAEQTCQEAQSYGVKAVAISADITQPNLAQSLVEQAAKKLAGLSVVVNNVGDYCRSELPTSQTTLEDWHWMMNSNLNSTFYVTQAAIPYLKAAQGARIINFGFASAQHLLARTTNAPYVIAKTGVIIYSKSLAQELILDKITVNVLSPGVIENSTDVKEVAPILPAKRAATLQEVANSVWFFVSPESEYITGQILEVSGAWML